MRDSVGKLVEQKGVRIAIKTFLVLMTTFLSLVFFGLFLPLCLLAMELVPDYGTASVVYFVPGAVLGSLSGGIVSAVSLARAGSLVTRTYVVLTASLVVACLLFLACYALLYERFSHL